MPDQLTALTGLAFSAFTSATVLPGTSEAVLVALHMSGAAPAWLLFVVASVANVAGSCVNWLIGRFASKLRDSRWLPGSETLARAERWFGRWGKWSLLLAWVPFVGDPLTFVGGLLRVSFVPFLILVGAGKCARYAAVMWFAAQL